MGITFSSDSGLSSATVLASDGADLGGLASLWLLASLLGTSAA